MQNFEDKQIEFVLANKIEWSKEARIPIYEEVYLIIFLFKLGKR